MISRRGTTLTEVVTASALFLMLLTGLITLSLGSSRTYSANSSRMTADDTVAVALQSISSEVRSASTTTVNTDQTSLTAVMPYVTEQGDYDRSRTGDTLQFYLSNGALYRKRNTENARAIARGVQSLKFTRNGSELKIEVTSAQQTGNKTSTASMSTQVALRNEPLY